MRLNQVKLKSNPVICSGSDVDPLFGVFIFILKNTGSFKLYE